MSSAMQLDCYKVEVLYLLNPHLIWVEVRDPAIVYDDNEIKFEQIGIYGMLPVASPIADDDEEDITDQREIWLPAAAARIWEFLENEEDVFFNPLHLDQGSSIFDDNVHKFGDLVVKKRNGKIRSIIKLLKNTGFATYDVCMFHQYLSLGKINTILSNVETHNVILELEKYYIRKNVPKNKWEDPIKHQTSMFRVSYNIEEALIDSKTKDLELCKDAGEPSSRRVSTRRLKEKKKSEKKLELMKNRKSKNGSIDSDTTDLQTIEDANAGRYSKKIYSKSDAQKAQILDKVMNKSAKKVSKQEKLVNRLLNESREKRDRKKLEDVENSLNGSDNPFFSSGQASASTSNHASAQGDIVDKEKNIEEINCASNETQLLKTDEIAAISKPVQNVLDKNDNHIVNHENGNNEMLITKSVQESSVKLQEYVVETTLKDDQVRLNVSNNVKYSQHHRRSTKGKSSKKGAKALKSETQQRKHPTSPLEKLAHPSQIGICESDLSRNPGSVPDLSDDHEPVSEHMVQKWITSFKLSDSKHSELIQNAMRKCKDGGKNSEAIADLVEVKNKMIDEVKQQAGLNNLATIHLDVPLVQKFSKNKLKKKAKKQNSNSGKNKYVSVPPGFDINKISRVPPLLIYDEKIAIYENQTAKVTSRLKQKQSAAAASRVVNDLGPSCSGEAHEKEIKNKRNGPRQEKGTCPTNSSMWEKRLKLHKEMAKNKRSASHISDTTNKDSSNPEEKSLSKNFTVQNFDEDSDDSISDSVEKLGIGYNNHGSNSDNNNKSSEYNHSEQTVKANSLHNYDSSLSFFVDKPQTPIMVHSKMDKHFITTCSFKDINFTDHIRLVLEKLHISRPMMLQSITWTAILRGYSVFMVGSTFSGKTMGYLPAVCRHVTDYHQGESFCKSVGPFCIIVCGTSHAVTDVDRTAKMLVGCDEKVVSCHYGHDEQAIATSLLKGCDLLVTTAPSLVRLIQMNINRLDLNRLVSFVLDDYQRLSEVYSNEIDFCLHKVREMFKSREYQGLNVQYIVASRIWCNSMESIAKEAPDSVVCIEAVQECVLYAKANMIVSYVTKADKLNRLFEFLNVVDPSKRTVVVCDTDEEVDFLYKAIPSDKYYKFATNSSMTDQDLYKLTLLWKEFSEPMVAPVLICHDLKLCHMNVVDASYLVQYSMPSEYTIFCKRFATLIKSYPSIYNADDNWNIKILILLDHHDLEQLPKVVQFLKRCSNNVPGSLDGTLAEILNKNDVTKAEICVPLCLNLVSYGDCPDFYDCHSRHTIFKDYDKPKQWMPKSGIVTFKICHFQTATCFSARLIANFRAGAHLKYPPAYEHMSYEMGKHYANLTNRIAFGTPKVGDVCAVALRHDLFCRAQVLKISNPYGNGSVKNVLVNLLDEEITETISGKQLYHLPDHFKREITYIVKVRLVNIQPRDKDLVFSQLVTDQIKVATSFTDSVYMKARIVLTVGNWIFVDTLEVCQDLEMLNKTVVIIDVKRKLLEKHADINLDHLPKVEKLCRRAGLKVISAEKKENESRCVVKVKPEITWAHIEEDMVMVEFESLETPNTMFVRLTKFKDLLKILQSEIAIHVANNPARLEDFEKDDIVLAEYPDCVYKRARIDEIGDINIKCFFVDQGEWHQITKDKIKSISDSLITQLPFQTIECRLVGIQPPGDQWTDYASNWLIDRCSESITGALKQLYVKYYTKEPAQYTGGYKYGMVVIDTYKDKEVVLNQLMIDLNLAKEDNDEIKYLENSKCKNECEAICKEAEGDNDSWEDLSKCSTNFESTRNKAIPYSTRPVPLDGTDDDSDSSGKRNINVTDDMAGMCTTFIEVSTQDLPPIENNKAEVIEETNVDSLTTNIDYCTSQLQQVKINPDLSNGLDSDDASSPGTAQCTSEASENYEKITDLNEYQIRKPKLNWRQTRTSVTIKIQLIGADSYDLQIDDRALTFAAIVNDTNFGFEFDLYGVIDKKTASHSNNGQYILVKLNKIMHKNWLTLTKDGGIRKWIVYDVDSIDTKSDVEEVQNNIIYNHNNIVKNINKDTNSDPEEGVNYGEVDNVNLNTLVTTK